MAVASEVGFTLGRNFQGNLQRIFSRQNAKRPSQRAIALDAGLTPERLNQLLNCDNPPNPSIETIEALAIALEVSVDTLLSPNPKDAFLHIEKKTSRKSA